MGYFDDNEDFLTGLPSRRRRGGRPLAVKFPPEDTTTAADMLWTMKDGTKIPFGKMATSHRTNALRALVRDHGKKRVLASRTGKALIECGVYADWDKNLGA